MKKKLLMAIGIGILLSFNFALAQTSANIAVTVTVTEARYPPYVLGLFNLLGIVVAGGGLLFLARKFFTMEFGETTVRDIIEIVVGLLILIIGVSLIFSMI